MCLNHPEIIFPLPHPQSVDVFPETSPLPKRLRSAALGHLTPTSCASLLTPSLRESKQLNHFLELWRKCPRPRGPVFFLVLTLGINQLGDIGQRHFLTGEAECSQTDFWFKS